MSRWAWWINALAAIAALPVLAVGAALLLLDPNDYKPQIIDAVQAATGRTLTLRGPLRVSRSLWPTLDVTDVLLANAPGGTRPDMARAERIEAQISLLALLQRRIDVTRLTLIGPNILFEQAEGQPNWVFTTPPDQPPDPAPDPAPASHSFQLRIRSVHVRNGMVTWRLPARTKVVGIRSLDYQHRVDGGPLEVRSTLVYADNQPFTLNATAWPNGGNLDPWTTQIQFAAFDSQASAQGTMDVAGHYDLQVEATSGALESLNALLPEMRLPPARQVVISSHVGNGKVPGDLPVIGATRLRLASADLGGLVPGLALGATQVSLAAPGGQASAAAVGQFKGTPFKLQAEFTAPIHPDGLVKLPIDLTVESTARPVSGSVALKGDLTLDTLRFAGLASGISLRTPALAALRPLVGRPLPALTEVRLDGSIAVPARPGPVRLSAAKLQTKQGDLEGDATVGLDPALVLTGRWRSVGLDLDAMLEAFGIDLSPATAPAATGPVIPPVPLPWAGLLGPDLDIAANIAALRFQDRIWRDVQLSLRLKAGRLHVGPAKLALPGGPVAFTMTVDAAAAAMPVSVSLQAPALPLSLVARYAGVPGPVAGAAQVGLEMHGSGRTLRELAASLDGPFSIAAVQGQFSNAALLALTAPALDALGIVVPAQGETRLACLGIAGSFAKGIGSVRTIALETSYLSLEGAGEVDLRRETVAFKLYPLAQVAGAPVAVPVVVQGPFRDIAGKLDATGLDKLGFLLDGVFGGDTSNACAHAGLATPR